MIKKFFAKDELLQKKINILYENLKGRPYDTKITWKEIKNIIGLDDIRQVYYVANKVCLLLMYHDSKYLATEHGVGKRIIKPNEHDVVAKKNVKKSVKIYKKSGAILASTNMDLLTDDEKDRVIVNANKYATLEMFANEMLKKKEIGKKSPDDVRTASLFLDAIRMFTQK